MPMGLRVGGHTTFREDDLKVGALAGDRCAGRVC